MLLLYTILYTYTLSLVTLSCSSSVYIKFVQGFVVLFPMYNSLIYMQFFASKPNIA